MANRQKSVVRTEDGKAYVLYGFCLTDILRHDLCPGAGRKSYCSCDCHEWHAKYEEKLAALPAQEDDDA